METKIGELQQELYATLKKAERNRKRIRYARILTYGCALVYFVGYIALPFFLSSGRDVSFLYTLNPNPTFFEQYKLLIFILPFFVLIIIGGFGLAYYQKKYTQAEVSSITHIIRTMFPEATLNLIHDDLHLSLVTQSNFFRRHEHPSCVLLHFWYDYVCIQ